jgi:flagellar protein FliL
MTLMTEAAAEAPVAPKKSPLMMIVIAIVALAAGGGGAYFFATKGDKGAQEEEQGADKEGKEKLPAQYVKLDPPFVVNFEAKGLMRFLQVTVEVMTRDAATIDLINKNDPMIRNDLIMLFGSQKYEDISSREGKEKLRADALKVISDVITAEGGKGEKVEQLYFTSFVMQ